jgi:hypothetical protein
MTSFLDTTINKYKQLLVNFGYDKLNAGVFVIAGNECENTKTVLEETGATVKICNGENCIEQVMDIIDSAKIPHCFLLNLNPLNTDLDLSAKKIQEIFSVVCAKLMRTHFYLLNIKRNDFIVDLDFIKKSMNSFGRGYQFFLGNYSDKDKYNFSSSFGTESSFCMIYPPE